MGQQSFDFDRLQQRLDDAYISVAVSVDKHVEHVQGFMAALFEHERRSLGQKTRYALARATC